jgi:hypothetical protein
MSKKIIKKYFRNFLNRPSVGRVDGRSFIFFCTKAPSFCNVTNLFGPNRSEIGHNKDMKGLVGEYLHQFDSNFI